MLKNKNCVPCQGGIPPLNKKKIANLINQIDADWNVALNKKLNKNYVFSEFNDAVKFLNLVADMAENQGHHPFIHLNYKTVKIILFTHKINGLHENDFLMANKIDYIHSKL